MMHCFKRMEKNRNQIWLWMEYKRAAVMLPSILRKAIILVAACLAAVGMIAFCAMIMQRQGDGEAKLRIGYTAPSNQLTDLAVSYVQSMDSIQSICNLEAVTASEGRQRLENGELAAWIVLPEDLINEILSGSNAPATVYLRENTGSAGGLEAVGSILFEELATAGMGMLGTAQAEIYAVDGMIRELALEEETGGFRQTLYDDINDFNLRTVAGREKVFHTKTLSLTGNDTVAVYYGSAVWTIYVLLAGLFMGEFCKRGNLQQTMADKRMGVCYMQQLGARCQAGIFLMAVVLLLPCIVYFIPQVREVLAVRMTLQGGILILWILFFVTVYHMMIYQIIEKRESALVVIGVLAILQSYLSGCLIPSVLLPEAVAAIGRFLPAALIKEGFTILFTGEPRAFYKIAWGLWIWGVVLFGITVLSMHIGARDSSTADLRQKPAKIRVPSLGMVLFRRLLHRKSMWISLAAIVVLSSLILRMEQASEVQIRVAVCDESGAFQELLAAYDGLVVFEQYESDAAVQRAVQRGDAECGYVLPETLAAKMTAQHARREILVYQDADAVAVPVVNEILFERIFRQVSCKWFEEYLLQNSVIQKAYGGEAHLRERVTALFHEELTAGTTFRFEIRRIGTLDKAAADDPTVYPVYWVATAAVVLCAIQGIWQVAADLAAQQFYRQNRVVVSAWTFMLPMRLGVLCAVVLILLQ